jgi:hypothetical protein
LRVRDTAKTAGKMPALPEEKRKDFSVYVED